MKSKFAIKLIVSAAATFLVALRANRPALLPADAVTVGLLIAVLLPWLGALVDSAEFPGGWKVKFRELKDEQARQRYEIDSLRFLMSSFVSNYELEHLTKLASDSPFSYQKSDPFLAELRRLRSLGLIANQEGKSIAAMPPSGDLTDFFVVTALGRSYLKMREQWQTLAADDVPQGTP